jgi:2-iminobutanoate/2-iminopropanoate deaminase
MNIFLKVGDSQPDQGCISNIVQLGDFFYVSAQCGTGKTFQEQALTAIYRIIEVLKDLDLRFDHVVKFTVYLSDIEMRSEFLSIYSNFVEAPYPAMSIVEVSALPEHSMIAIEACGVNTLRHERKMKMEDCPDCE